MIDPDDKENIAYNYSFPKGKASYKSDDFDDDLGCVTLSESEDDATPDIGELFKVQYQKNCLLASGLENLISFFAFECLNFGLF